MSENNSGCGCITSALFFILVGCVFSAIFMSCVGAW